MSHPGFSILEVAWLTPRLVAAKRAEARLPVHVVTAEWQQGMNAGQGIPQVRNARQARPPQADGANRVAHRRRSPDARQGAARLINAESGVRLVANAKQEASHNVFALFSSP